MLESRNSYGWGYVGSDEKGFEWEWIYGSQYHERMKSGYVYATEEEAIKEGNAFRFRVFDPINDSRQWGTIQAVKATPKHFEY